VWLVAGIVAGVVLLTGGVWWAHGSLRQLSYLEVREIRVRGNVHVQTAQILSRLRLRPPVNSLQLDLEELAGRITTHPWVLSASIQRQPPLNLIITVEERRPVALLSMGKTYLLSADAVILEEVRGRPESALPLLRAVWKAQARAGEHLDDRRLLGGLALLEMLQEAPLLKQTPVEEVTAEADGNYVLRLTGNRTILRIGPEPLAQLHRLGLVLGHREARLESFAYADLRFPGRVILKSPEKGG
jgi:cell division protein FtsQ